MSKWPIFRGSGTIEDLPPPPQWRRPKFKGEPLALDLNLYQEQTEGDAARGEHYEAGEEEISLVNAALFLRRPLLITGKPGSGKSSLAYAVAHELKLGPVLLWPISTRATLQDGLYRYDPLARLQDANLGQKQSSPPDIGKYLRLGPLGTAMLPYRYPRVLLIDEIDKSDIDLPNDLLNIFEEGEFEIPELVRLTGDDQAEAAGPTWIMPYDGRSEQARVALTKGRVYSYAFPLVVLTSNGEREFPPAFLRRCLRLEMPAPDPARLARIVKARFGFDEEQLQKVQALIDLFIQRRDGDGEELATDQLLNAIHLTTQGVNLEAKDRLLDKLLQRLDTR